MFGKTMGGNIAAVIGLALFMSACAAGPEPETEMDVTGAGAAPAEQEIVTEEIEERVPRGPAPGSQADLVQNVGDRVFFAFDRYDLSAEARSTLEKQAAWLQLNRTVTVTIEGHADERGTREYNLALGERRANAAKNYLVALGVAPDRISLISYGEERPAVVGSNERAWAQNRRAATTVN